MATCILWSSRVDGGGCGCQWQHVYYGVVEWMVEDVVVNGNLHLNVSSRVDGRGCGCQWQHVHLNIIVDGEGCGCH